MTQEMKPGEWTTSNSKPAIIWHRHGIAAKGEPSVVEEVRTYESDAERLEAMRGAQTTAPDAKPLTGIPSQYMKDTVLRALHKGLDMEALQGYEFLTAKLATNFGVFVVNGNFGREHFKKAVAEAEAAGLSCNAMHVYAETATYSGPRILVTKFDEMDLHKLAAADRAGQDGAKKLEHLQALGFLSQEDYQDHQRVIQASRDLAAQQLATLHTEPREGLEYPRG